MPGINRLIRFIRQDAGALWLLLLVFLAGFLNAAGLLRFGQTMSHMTGNLTRLGLALSSFQKEPVLLFVLCILGFFLGALLSGYSFPAHRAGLWQRSGLVLLCCGLLLCLMTALSLPALISLPALALVLGAQNGLALRFRGILTRTTHMTGHLTDCGAALGRMMANRAFRGEDLRLFLFHLSCLLFFALGVLACALLSAVMNVDLLFLGGVMYALAGGGTLFRAFLKRDNL